MAHIQRCVDDLVEFIQVGFRLYGANDDFCERCGKAFGRREGFESNEPARRRGVDNRVELFFDLRRCCGRRLCPLRGMVPIYARDWSNTESPRVKISLMNHCLIPGCWTRSPQYIRWRPSKVEWRRSAMASWKLEVVFIASLLVSVMISVTGVFDMML